MDVSVEFRKVIPITKAWEGDDGGLYIEGESSGPEIDLDGQFMTPECIKNMAEQVNKKPVPFGYYDEHNKRGVMSDLGEVIGAEITPEYHMRNRVRLDKDNPAAVLLWKKIHNKRKQFGMSIAGHIQELARKTIGDKVYKGFNRIHLDHLANTTKPSWAPSLGTLVAKSLEQDGFDWETAPEYEGEIFVAVEKRSKPDPKAGKGYLLVEQLLKQLNSLFGWETYQDMVDEQNRDVIPLQDVPALQPLFPVAGPGPAKSFDPDDDETIAYIEKTIEVAGPAPGIHDIRTLADVYDRLFWLANSIQNRDKAAGKKTVTKLKAAMTAITEAMKQQIAQKSQQPQPLVYGDEGIIETPVAEVAKEETMPGSALTSFEQVDATAVGTLPIVEKGPQPSVGATPGAALTSFQQVADDLEERVAKEQAALGVGEPAMPLAPAVAAPTPVGEIVGEFGDFVAKVFESDAPLAEKRTALAEVGQSFFGRLGQMLEGERPEEDRIKAAVMKAVAPLVEKIENLERQLAVAKSYPASDGSEPEMVRKSLTIGVRPARIVEQQQEAPTFEDLIRYPQGGGWAPRQ
jgi:hypothetical protein